MNISKASEKDIPQLVKLINSAYRGEHSKKGWTTEADLLDGIRTDDAAMEEMLGKDHAVILKFRGDDNSLQGCVYLEKRHYAMYLGMLTVSPTEQAKGIGKQMLAAAEQYAASEQCSSVEMTVISIRQELIDWYLKHGYYITGEKKPFPTDKRFGIPKQPLEFLVLRKDIQIAAEK
jgi:ribosomal protein S18 acetylase RimI-like enzyme